MRKLILSLTLVFGALALAGCSEEVDDDYEEYEYEGNEMIEVDTNDEDERPIIIEREEYEEYDD